MDVLCSNGISPPSFYGRKSKRLSLAIKSSLEKRSRQMKQEKIPDTYHARLLGPSARWQIFHRQQEALSLVRNVNEDLHVFAFECDQLNKQSGQRQFLVSSYPVFWHYYMQLDQSRRHHYEVIPEGAACKLYFDLEFQRSSNPAANGVDMVDTLIQYVCGCLKELYGVQCGRDDVLELTASTETKFSRHLIFQHKDCVFKDNINAGNFVQAIFCQLEEYLLTQVMEHEKEMNQVQWNATHKQDMTEVCCVERRRTDMQKETDSIHAELCNVAAETWTACSKIQDSCDSCHVQGMLPKPEMCQPSSAVDVFNTNLSDAGDNEMLTYCDNFSDRSGEKGSSFLPGPPAFCSNFGVDFGQKSCLAANTEVVQTSHTQRQEYLSVHSVSQDISLCEEKEVQSLMEERVQAGVWTCVEKREEVPSGQSEQLESLAVKDGKTGQRSTAEGKMETQVKWICDKVFQQFDDLQLSQLFVKDKDGKDTCFADLGVYTKNRNFRLYRSCKLGKKVAFNVAKYNTHVAADPCHLEDTDQQLFLASLITNIRDASMFLVFDDKPCHSQPIHKKQDSIGGNIHPSTDHMEGSGKSPYPEVDDYLRCLLFDKGGAIRRWVYFPAAEILNFDIVGYRFCYNVGRQHRSNNIKLVADLRHGVWYQKCYDPDCQAINFKSEEFQLPKEVLLAQFLADDFEDMCEDSIDDDNDEVCLLALEGMEQHVDSSYCGT